MTMPTPPTHGSLQLTRRPECSAPAEIGHRTVLESTAGPIEHVKVRCVHRHVFLLPTDMLDRAPAPAPAHAPRLTPR
jgi:hypothetical protein